MNLIVIFIKSIYVGKISRPHQRTYWSFTFGDIANKLNQENCSITSDQFNVVTHNQNDFELSTKEILVIKRLNPILNNIDPYLQQFFSFLICLFLNFKFIPIIS